MDRGRKCSVPGCTRNGYTLHNLPKEPNTQRAWLMFVYKQIPVKFDPHLFVCSNHFTEDSFQNLGQFRAGFSIKLKLKQYAVPTVWSSQWPASTSYERKFTTDVACQTDAPSVASCATQLSHKTLRPHLRSKGIQATVQCQSVAVGTKTPSVTGSLSSTPSKGLSQAKRPRLEVEDDDSYTGTAPQGSSVDPTTEHSPEETNIQTCVSIRQKGGGHTVKQLKT